MKKHIAIALFLTIGVWFLSIARPAAAEEKRRRTGSQPRKAEPALKESSSPVKQFLKSQEWIIYLVPINDESANPQMDILSFSGNKFNSRNLSSKGFKEFDYALSEDEGSPRGGEAAGAVSWEASQAIDSGEIASWHAELKDKLMRGVLSILKKDGTIEDLYFTTQAVKEVGAERVPPLRPAKNPRKPDSLLRNNR